MAQLEQMSEEQILGAFEQRLPGNSEEVAEQAPKTAQQPETPTAPEGEQPEQTEQPETEATASDSEQEETATIEIDPDEPLFEQEVLENGTKTTQKLSLKELQQGYLRQADYTRKNQEVAKARAEVQEHARQAQQQAAGQFAQRLDQLQAALVKTVAPELANVDWDKLANEDAFEYVRLSNRAKQINDVLQAIETDKSAANEVSNQQQQQKKTQTWQQSLEVLQKDIPDWGAPVAQRLSKAAQDVGFAAEEVAQWDDYRIIKLAHKAAMYDDQQAQVAPTAKKIALVPRVLKPGSKQPAKTATVEARQKLTKSGKPEDALPFFEALVR